MRAGPYTYYHGTLLQRAVDALVQGDCLRPLHPEGSGRRFARSAAGVCYLTPCFRVASDYAVMTNRDDWPEWADDEAPYAERAHVFAFDLADVERVIVEEDELGWAVQFAADVALGHRQVGRAGGLWLMNDPFARSVGNDADLAARIGDEARRVLVGNNPGGRFGQLMAGDLAWRPSDRTAAGKKLRAQADPVLLQDLIGRGISVGIKDPVTPIAAWSFERQGRRGPDGLLCGPPDRPEDADPLDGPWSAVRPGIR